MFNNVRLLFLIFSLVVMSCNKKKDILKHGDYIGYLEVDSNKYLPFNYEIKNDSLLVVSNSLEKVNFQVEYINDSIFIKSRTFEGYIKGVVDDDKVSGYFIIESLDRVVPFSSKPGKIRFNIDSQLNPKLFNNSWKLTLNKGQENESKSIANFQRYSDRLISSTFRTNTGDYGFLEGVYNNNTITLSTFNGSRAYLIEAEMIGDSLFGFIYQGNHGKLNIEGSIDNSFELDDEYSLTKINNSKHNFNFEFEDLNGTLVSLSDKKYLNKAIVVQIMGSWCPNCLDETRFFVDYLNKNDLDGIEFIALAFEYSKTKDLAISNILKLKQELNIPYSILLAQYGSSDKNLAKDKLPMLVEVVSYPTTIFLNKNKEVVKIHTGFNGPATGVKYDKFKEEFNKTIELLLVD